MNAEAEYLYSVLLDPQTLSTHPIPEDWFTASDHRRAHRALRDLAEDDRVNTDGLAAAMGTAYVANLVSGRDLVPAATATREMEERASRRHLQGLARDLMTGARDPLTPVGDTVARILSGLTEMKDRRGDGPSPINEVLQAAMRRVEAVHASGIVGLETGISLLDHKILALEPEHLYLIGARPKCGKTALAMQVAAHACTQGKVVYFASREMGAVQFGMRLLSQQGRIRATDLRQAKLRDVEYGKLTQACSRFAAYGSRFLVDCRAGLSWEQLQASILRAHAREGLGLLCIDYVQLLRLSERSDQRSEELERITYSCKELAKTLRAPVILLSQLNRGQDDSKPPESRHHKGSGGLEQAADVSILLWKPDPNNETTVEVIIDLNRVGPTAKFKISFAPEYTLFD